MSPPPLSPTANGCVMRACCEGPVLSAWTAEIQKLGVDIGHNRHGLGLSADTSHCWVIVDWMVRDNAPRWLRSAGLTTAADQLTAMAPICSHNQLSLIMTALDTAALAGNDAFLEAWTSVVNRAEVGGIDRADSPDRNRCWQSLTATADQLSRQAMTAIAAAESSVAGCYRHLVPSTWRAAGAAINEAVDAITWTAIHRITATRTWSWTAPPTQTLLKAGAAISDALAPIEAETHTSARQLTQHLALVHDRCTRHGPGSASTDH